MKWARKGKIFDPTQFRLPNNCTEFAQSPQALVFDDLVRIYFSTRKRDQSGMYQSCIAYADFDTELSKILSLSQKTVIDLGKLGIFDEHGIFPFSPLMHNDKITALQRLAGPLYARTSASSNHPPRLEEMPNMQRTR